MLKIGRPRVHQKYLDQALCFSLASAKGLINNVGAEITAEWASGDVMQVHVRSDSLLFAFVLNGSFCFQSVWLDRIDCHFGSRRTYLRCECGNKSAKLFLTDSRKFVCRKCTGLPYRSKSQRYEDSSARSLSRLKRKIDPQPCALDEYPLKPKGMHKRRYQQIEDKIVLIFAKRQERILAKVGRRSERLTKQFENA